MFKVDKNIVIIGTIVVGLLVGVYFLNNMFGKEGYDNIVAIKTYDDENKLNTDNHEMQDVGPNESPEKQMGDAVEIDQKNMNELKSEEMKQGVDLQPTELLPRDTEAEKYFENAAPQVPGSLEHKNFLESAYHIGVDTQNSSMKNANRQLRSDPPIAKENVSVWNNSTFVQDKFRKHFEIGQ
jgi:uncharacterized protein YneF (UPF0154 family)